MNEPASVKYSDEGESAYLEKAESFPGTRRPKAGSFLCTIIKTMNRFRNRIADAS